MHEHTHSRALIDAARVDRDRLQETWEDLRAQRTAIADELGRLDSALAEMQTAIRRLGEIIGDERQLPLTGVRATGEAIGGADVRRVAAAVGLENARAELPWHYMDWYAAVLDAGYSISGTDPQAVFLTQLSRSPLTTKCAEGGCYRLDRKALVVLSRRVATLRRARDELVGETQGDDDTDIDVVADRLQQISRQLSKAERALAEGLATARELNAIGWFDQPDSQGSSWTAAVPERNSPQAALA